MNKLVLIQHIANTVMDYNGFAIKPGMYYWIVKTPFGNIPAAWSGWTSGREIALYTLLNGEWSMRWVNEKDVPLWHIALDTEEWEEIPFFCVA
jgi:hypothetical protein